MIRSMIAALTVSLLLFGCQAANKPPANEAAPTPQQVKNEPDQRAEQTAPRQEANRSAQEKADHLAKLATDTPNVTRATAVVAGRYAIVGIDVDSTLDRSRVGTLKYTVAQALKEDPDGANALVTADTDLTQRLREVSEDARQGRPMSGILEELADIAGRIVPQPSNQVEQQEQPPTQTDQEKMNQTPGSKKPRQDKPKQH